MPWLLLPSPSVKSIFQDSRNSSYRAMNTGLELGSLESLQIRALAVLIDGGGTRQSSQYRTFPKIIRLNISYLRERHASRIEYAERRKA